MNKSLTQILQNITNDRLVDLVAMKELAKSFSNVIKKPVILLLWGDLGAGKTTFTQSFIKEKIPSAEVTSPTFNLIHIYDDSTPPLLHADLYRLESPCQIEETGFYDLILDHISLVEWPERLNGVYPKNAIHIHIDIINDEQRRIRVRDNK